MDLHEVMETEKVTVSVPVEAVGEAAGVKNGGGVLEHVMFKIRVRGLPKDVPEVITVDVSSLVGFAAIVVTLLVVNLSRIFGGGLHSYA